MLSPRDIFITKVKLYFLRSLYKTFKELAKEAGFAPNHFTKIATNTYGVSKSSFVGVGQLFDKYANVLDKRRIECILSDDSHSVAEYFSLPLNDGKFDSLLRYYVTLPTHSIDNLNHFSPQSKPRRASAKLKSYNLSCAEKYTRPTDTLGQEMVEKIRAFIRQHNANKTDL